MRNVSQFTSVLSPRPLLFKNFGTRPASYVHYYPPGGSNTLCGIPALNLEFKDLSTADCEVTCAKCKEHPSYTMEHVKRAWNH
jgi:hypothetical protein